MQQPIVLVVDDEPNNFDVIESLLSHTDYELQYLSNGAEAIRLLEVLQPDLILLDVMMPELDGIETCRRIKATAYGASLPIIIVSALSRKEDLSRCLAAGADDFIHKPVHRVELDARIRSMLRIRQQYKKLDDFNAQLELQVQERTRKLHDLIYRDDLTDLGSRTALLEKIEDLQAANCHSCALVYIDCDHFSLVNGSFGNDLANNLIRAISKRLSEKLLPGDFLARIGEDKFCYLLTNPGDQKAIEAFIEDVQSCFKVPFLVDSCGIYMSVCVGVSACEGSAVSPKVLLQNADTAMYHSKQKGKGSIQFFEAEMQSKMLERILLENDLKRALEEKQFFVQYQPIFNLCDGRLQGFEALIRWNHPEKWFVSPGKFISSMETTGLIIPVGLFVLEEACKQLREWHRMGHSELKMSVNLSVRQFSSPPLLKDIYEILEKTQIPPNCLNLEITESAIMDNPQLALSVTQELSDKGIRISIDDFGTGYSSLGYLHRFPVNTLKIDRSFVNQVHTEGRTASVVKSILLLSDQIGIMVTAEGIESNDQLQYLKNLGCQFGQGYLFSKPLSAPDIEKRFLTSKHSDNALFLTQVESPTV